MKTDIASAEDSAVQSQSNKADHLNRLRVVEDELLERLAKTAGDGRWLAIARTHIEEGFSAWKRGIFDGKRVGDD